MFPYFRKILDHSLSRSLLIIISLLFIAGGAFNDGWTGWFWAGPFVWILYFFLPGNWKTKGFAVLIIFILMYGMSNYKYQSQIVYPVIGQRVIVKQDIPLRNGMFDTRWFLNDCYIFEGGMETLCIEGKLNVEDFEYIPKNTVLHVSSVEVSHADLGLHHIYVLSNDQYKMRVYNRHLEGFIGDTSEEKRMGSFCSKVEWGYCDEKINSTFPDPMRHEFRLISELMYYPAVPLLLYGWIKN